MKKNTLIYFTLFSVISLSMFGQKSKQSNLGTNKVKNEVKFVSINVISTYERVAEKGYKSIDMFQKLGNSFYENFEYEKAARWYGELFKMTTDLDQKYYQQYAHSLKLIGQNGKASELLEKYDTKFVAKLESPLVKK
jgi:tetratricopeptide (TPR) repeat protein